MGMDRVAETLRQKVEDCKKAGSSEKFTVELKKLLTEYQSVFRLELGRDPPVDMPSLVVNLKYGAHPERCKARRYGPEQRKFMLEHVAELERAGLVYKTPVAVGVHPPDCKEARSQ